MVGGELDLCDMMSDPNVDPYEQEEDYNHTDVSREDAEGYDGFGSSQELGMALALAETIAEENEVNADPAVLFEDFQESLEKISLKSRHKSKVPVPAFEQYVYNKCGIA